jgi:RHS repeat-associated protein
MTYDDLDRLVGVTAGSQQGGNAVFAYDVLDNIRQLDQGTRTVRHTYDGFNRLDTITNAAGTLLSSYNFDTRGNLTTRTTGAVTDTFTFDKANRLMASTVGGVDNTYTYDGLGRRVREFDTASTYFFYGRSGQLLYTNDLKTSLRHNHIYLAGSLVAKRTVPFSGTPISVRYQHTDALGSPVAETSETGVLTRRERMTAYGEPADGTWQSGPGFTGHQMDATSRLVYMQQRYYDPVSGGFLSADPMASDAQNGWNFNRYNYAANNAYKFTDPDGRQARENANSPSTGIPFIDWLMTPSDARGSQRQMMERQFAFELSQKHSAKDVVRFVAISLSAGTGAAGGVVRASASADGAATSISMTSGATRASATQIRVSMTAEEARANLAANGYKWSGSETTPGAGTMTNGNVTYEFAPTSDSTGLPSAKVIVDGKRKAKLRFDRE